MKQKVRLKMSGNFNAQRHKRICFIVQFAFI